ncbi:hypothetical protein DFH07DRAFT_975047 [Mycena maculata]|uniref:Uncharacterized protein n=1 Tax=Mycena maculata TaxID=230809 RepID=A0AAD7H3Q8_9AGAR|nr:hypothetical protein DFH07DRAFT_975047 [Mycena maculata]
MSPSASPILLHFSFQDAHYWGVLESSWPLTHPPALQSFIFVILYLLLATRYMSLHLGSHFSLSPSGRRPEPLRGTDRPPSAGYPFLLRCGLSFIGVSFPLHSQLARSVELLQRMGARPRVHERVLAPAPSTLRFPSEGDAH